MVRRRLRRGFYEPLSPPAKCCGGHDGRGIFVYFFFLGGCGAGTTDEHGWTRINEEAHEIDKGGGSDLGRERAAGSCPSRLNPAGSWAAGSRLSRWVGIGSGRERRHLAAGLCRMGITDLIHPRGKPVGVWIGRARGGNPRLDSPTGQARGGLDRESKGRESST